MKFAHVLVLLSLVALPMNAALAQGTPDVKSGQDALAEVKMLKDRGGKLTDAEVERLKVIKKTADRAYIAREFMGRHQGTEVWAEVTKMLDLVIAEHAAKGGTGIDPPLQPKRDIDTPTTILLTSFALADFCADRSEAFQPPEIAKLKDRIASMLDELRVPKEKRDTVWQASQRGLKASGMEQLKSRDLAGECGKHREAVTAMFPGVLSSVGKKNPF
ncbi:hypothetical protein V1279_003018 [Bradyrhizobium sp. AZCC 1610]|uniref:hypothetical protein n=1 Tax=Bradyrhizobium sp. AZCC 1610 TaxID=3117020 RepID=UPI002FF05852